ncbi:hypothetical protein SUGI_0965920 [Cryptomeria japonica]|nr:hypothetical protein SUGI_0965920 [Cryptomeria japonica]
MLRLDDTEAIVVINMRESATSEDRTGSAKHQLSKTPRDHRRLQVTNEWGEQLALRDLIHLHLLKGGGCWTTINRYAIESSHVRNFDLDKEEGQDDRHVSVTESVVELCDVESNIAGGRNSAHPLLHRLVHHVMLKKEAERSLALDVK